MPLTKPSDAIRPTDAARFTITSRYAIIRGESEVRRSKRKALSRIGNERDPEVESFIQLILSLALPNKLK
jgi:hypothetical protein